MRTIPLLLFLSFAIVGLAGDGHPQAPPPAQLLPGTSIEQPTRFGADHHYTVDLEAGAFVDIAATQRQVDVRFTIVDPTGNTRLAVLPQSSPFPAHVMFIVDTTGPHRVELHVNDPGRPSTPDLRVTIGATTRLPPTNDDRERVRIASLTDRAGALIMEQKFAALEQAIPLLQEAAASWRTLGDSYLEAATVTALAHVTALFTQYRVTSADAYRHLIELTRTLRERDVEIDAWNRLAAEYLDDGQVARARDAALEAVALTRTAPDQRLHAANLHVAALAELRLGNYESSRELAGQALDCAVSIGDRAIEGYALAILARLQGLSGDTDGAIHQQERAVATLRGLPRLGHLRDELTTLGAFYLNAGRLDEAEARFAESLDLANRSPYPDIDALTYIGLADVATARGDRARARTLYEDARARLLKSGHSEFLCRAEARYGRLLLAEGELTRSEMLLESALAIGRGTASPSCEAESRLGLSDLMVAMGRIDDAHSHVMRLVQLKDGFREASSSIDTRTIGFAAIAPVYERAVEISMRLAAMSQPEQAAGALLLNERALARGLLDGLTMERLERTTSIQPALAGEYRGLRDTWRARVIEHEIAGRRRATTRAAALADEIASLTTRLRDVEARIDAIHPRLAAFARPPRLELDDIRALLDEDTLLVEFALGDVRSYAWVVDTAGVKAFTLAPRQTIEAAVRRAHSQLAEVPDAGSDPTRRTADATPGASLDDLSRLVIEPIAPLLTKKRLVIVAPGALALVPFGVLPDARRQPLLARHEVVSLPSISVLAALRSLDARRQRPAGSVAVFADPVYERDDPRLQSRAALTSTTRSLVRSTQDDDDVAMPRGWTRTMRGALALTRLPFSRREAAAIRQYAPNPSLSLVGLDASRERVVASDLGNYRIVHFAAHGLLHPDVPNLSGLALSLVDARGRARNGFLMLPDVYDLKLNADLVVLSACETGLGNEIRGEGVVGLPRGFMYAGAARVVSSLWRVDDEATAALMAAFYRRLLRDGATPASALRAAQLEIRATPRWRSPFFWAGFILQGDWR